MNSSKATRAFTLIELLIVVAIIAILAAIAVPNFLEAQTRAKVSRVKADQRTYATAIESYYVDFNAYPVWQGLKPIHKVLIPLSTPVAYLSSSLLPDPFNNKKGQYMFVDANPNKEAIFFYSDFPDTPITNLFLAGGMNQAEIKQTLDRRWMIASAGPDAYLEADRYLVDHPGNIVGSLISQFRFVCLPQENGIYDPTNGTVSRGEIVRNGHGILDPNN